MFLLKQVLGFWVVVVDTMWQVSGLLGSRCRSCETGVLALWIVGVSSMWQVSMDGQQGERRPQNESVG